MADYGKPEIIHNATREAPARLRLFRDCGPFMVVLIDYCVPQRCGIGIDFLSPLTHGIGLATAIQEISPSQGIIIAALDYRNAAEVPRPQQLMHVPVLIDVSNFQLRRLLEKIEIERRIEMLTVPELLKLRRFGDFRVRGMGGAARGRTGEDLLDEAILRTLIGAESTQKGRHWNRDVDFVRHLAGAMQSICSCWKRQFSEMEAHLVSEFPVHDEDGQERSPLDNVASGHRSTAKKDVQATRQKSSGQQSSATKTSTKQVASLERPRSRLAEWAWCKRRVDPLKDHLELRYGPAEDSGWDDWEQVARVSRPIDGVFGVDFILNRKTPNYKVMMDETKKELDFYLVELHERDPWLYARYHCGTTANVYSTIHWSFISGKVDRQSKRIG